MAILFPDRHASYQHLFEFDLLDLSTLMRRQTIRLDRHVARLSLPVVAMKSTPYWGAIVSDLMYHWPSARPVSPTLKRRFAHTAAKRCFVGSSNLE